MLPLAPDGTAVAELADPGPKAVRVVLGIDPGLTGGIAFLFPAWGRVAAEDVPLAGGEVDVDTLAARLRQMAPTVAVIERVHSMPKQGVSSTFKFGMAYGALRAVVAAMQIPTHLVTPQAWKRHFRLGADKEESRELALRLWPGERSDGAFRRKKDHGRAEAALIARYGAEKGMA